MYIVGTSGHIDHGKTSLIKALTDIDCDRLPEEKEREMTIDIGFASISYPKLGTVSIIDVPGHERFIRNMVVGAWGIDLALLVVAVDDGWMPQTEDHFRVLQLLNIERIIVVLNKIDLADEEMAELVTDEVREKLLGTRYEDAGIVRTSSRTGAGIEELKSEILANLKKLSRAPMTSKPYLYVDRVFASKGYGTIVTGTLKNGVFHDDDTVEILPLMKSARIKKIESHHSSLTEGNPSQRTALNLSGVSVDEMKRGYILYKNGFFTQSSDVIVRIQVMEKGRVLKNNLEIELLIGATSIKGKIILLGDEGSQGESPVVRIKFREPWFFYPEEPFIVTNPGGFRVIGGGIVLFPHYIAERHKANLKELVKKFSGYTKEEIYAFIIDMNGSMMIGEINALFQDSEKKISSLLSQLRDQGHIIIRDNHVINSRFYQDSLAAVTEIIKTRIGLNLKEISDMAGIDASLARIIAQEIVQGGAAVEKDGRYFAGNFITEETLSDQYRKILQDLLRDGKAGIELERIENDSMKKGVKELIKLGFCVSLDGNIVYHRKVYEELKEKIMVLFQKNDRLSMPDAKEATGVTRKYIIPLLNRIERDGLMKRVGDFRIKA